MNPKTVGMITSYPGANQSDWLWQQTPESFGKWGNIIIRANAPQPDFLLLYQFDFPRKSTPKKKISLRERLRQLRQPKPPEPNLQEKFRGVPKERMIYLLREPPLEEILEINQHNYQQAQLYCDYVSGPDKLAPVPDYMPAIWYHGNSFRELNEMASPEKIRTCSWITSGVNRSQNHQRRLNFLKQIVEQKFEVDIYGRNLPSWSNAQGSLNNKWYGMAPYYYNLSIENYAENDLYVSEKLWDALLAWCLPIYYGGPAADKLLPPGSFLRLPSIDEKGIAFIKEVISTPEHWYAAKEAIAEARQIILHKLNLMAWLDGYVSKFL
ncbi:glycosyltransferase family 10 [Limnoraphis robusta Tam1]|uniref:Glycosyltransferase family 10 n=1 Tax=Limnoraphis robusta CCNP1315 TaxID=3110306 RepID=A0ABU5U5X5_9CYAN|nr:glycosyltransferase family 10 [Limnoraphis robusta]MEA5498862.1 glycosyltransferase family 10 [Limnoraphis robusta BA-68 BA1]MEA5522611.1 glycosyltransferase family 10 [Limnoraphis robusta CCNP1315]MEA5541923.1 glycosyltransferase family 10 [Limnoraphis robusta Tam1]MEA5546522.1 glycosyltransferase family 10 [Limnoraphis robusta CCNP1324]